MSLPVIETFAFPVTLPSTGQSIAIRPYLVREEKLLLMAQESDNHNDQIEAVSQIIKNCTNGVVDPRTVPYFDVEYLLLQIRARSVGEIASPIYQCQNPTPQGAVCNHKTPLRINLLDIKVAGLERTPAQFEIPISDRYTLRLRYPNVYTVHQLAMEGVGEGGKFKTASFMESLCDLFDTLEDRHTNTTVSFDNYTTEESLVFLESLRPEIYERIIEFLDTMPTVSYNTQYTCEQCGFVHTVALSGVVDFLG